MSGGSIINGDGGPNNAQGPESLGPSQWQMLQRVRSGGVMIDGDWEQYQQFYQSAFAQHIPLERLDNEPILPYTFTQVVVEVRDDKGEKAPLLLIKRIDNNATTNLIAGGIDGRDKSLIPSASINDTGYAYDFYSVVDDKFTNCNPNDISLLNAEVPAPYPDAMIGADRFRVVALADAQLIDMAYCQDRQIVDQWLKIQQDKLHGRLRGGHDDGFVHMLASEKLQSSYLGYHPSEFTKNYLKGLRDQLAVKGWQTDWNVFETVVGELILPRIMYLTGPDGEGVFSRDGVLDFIRETIRDNQEGKADGINMGLMPHLVEAFCKQTVIAPTEQSAKQIEDVCKLIVADELQLNSAFPDRGDKNKFLLLLAEAITTSSHRSQPGTQESTLALSNAREIFLQALIENPPATKSHSDDKVLRQLILEHEDQTKRMGYVIKFIDRFSNLSANELGDNDLEALLNIIDKETAGLSSEETMVLHHKLTEVWGEKLADMFKQSPGIAAGKPLSTRLLLARAFSTRQPITATALKSVTEPMPQPKNRFGGSGGQLQQQLTTNDPTAIYLILNSDSVASRDLIDEYKFDVYGQQLEVVVHTEKSVDGDKSNSLEQIESILNNLVLLHVEKQVRPLSAKAAANLVEQVIKSIDINSTAAIYSIFSIIGNAARLKWDGTPAKRVLNSIDAGFTNQLNSFKSVDREIITLLTYYQQRAAVFSSQDVAVTTAKVPTAIELLTKGVEKILPAYISTGFPNEIPLLQDYSCWIRKITLMQSSLAKTCSIFLLR